MTKTGVASELTMLNSSLNNNYDSDKKKERSAVNYTRRRKSSATVAGCELLSRLMFLPRR